MLLLLLLSILIFMTVQFLVKKCFLNNITRRHYPLHVILLAASDGVCRVVTVVTHPLVIPLLNSK